MLFEGHTQRDIARRLGLSKDVINRHYARHYPHFLTKARNAQDVAKADSIMKRVLTLEQRAYGILDAAEDSENLAAALGGIREARETIKLLAQVAGQLQVEGTTNILIAPIAQEAIIRALEPYGEARLAVSNALEELEAMHDGS